MRRFGKNEGEKTNRLSLKPLCLFCYPETENVSFVPREKKTYVTPTRGKKVVDSVRRTRKKFPREGSHPKRDATRSKEVREIWPKKRKEVRVIRRRSKEPIRNLKSYLFASVNYEKVRTRKTLLPTLFEVLETVKDAWPPPPKKNFSFQGAEDQKRLDEDKMLLGKTKMKEEIYLQFPSPLINRRFSMPEELMRKYFIMKQKTSEESETNKTMDEIPSSTSSTLEKEAPKKSPDLRTTMEKSESLDIVKKSNVEEENIFHKCQQANAQPNRVSETSIRATQTDFYDQGGSVIKVKKKSAEVDACTCKSDKASSTSVSFKDETNESETTESIPSSAPVQLPKRESFSDNLSSESDCMRCTCRELTSSKETSTDIFHSGKSTLSQTVSEKSLSTQDSTLSINSVSTRGSTASDNSTTTTPDVERTSAKESTTSDYSPKTPRTNMNRKNQRKDRHHRDDHKQSCPKHHMVTHTRDDQKKRFCSVQSNYRADNRKSCGTNTNFNDVECFDPEIENPNKEDETTEAQLPNECDEKEQTNRLYTWAKLSQDELYMMQQLRHQKLVESRFTIPVDGRPEVCDLYSSECDEAEYTDESIMIPRYSAIPRTLSMLVNTSSTENSIHNSDSDNQSLADSLEDQPIHCVRKFYFDTKNESKPVRGEVKLTSEIKQRMRSPKGKAFFVSIKNSCEENEMSEDIEKIPQPPEKIKNQISERHLKLSTKHSRLREKKREKKNKQKKRKIGSVKNEKSAEKNKKTIMKDQRNEDGKKIIGKKKKNAVENEEVHEEREECEEERQQKVVAKVPENERKKVREHGGRFTSKIPILVSGRSPERDPDAEEKQSEKREKTVNVVETTQILEITKTDNEITLQKPQSLISKSQNPMENAKIEERNHLTMPPLLPNLKTQLPYRPNLNRQQLLTSQTKRSPISKYRQRFEVIPEEKSSSLSSNEDRNSAETLPKFTNAATSPLPPKTEDSENLTETTEVAAPKTLPYLKKLDDQKLIFFSSKPKKNANSSKGRDALIAMNRDDFNRLAKGWMNFYKLSEISENSDAENNEKKEGKNFLKSLANKEKDSEEVLPKSAVSDAHDGESKNKKSNNPKRDAKNAENFHLQTNQIKRQVKKPMKVDDQPEIDENIQFHSSNTILGSMKSTSPNNSIRTMTKRQDPSLPDLKAPIERDNSNSLMEILPKVAKDTEDNAECTDSDSTDYMEPPSPRVPPLPLEDFPSDGTLSSSEGEGENNESKPQVMINPIKSCQLKKRGVTNRSRLRKEQFFEIPRFGKKKQSGWSVTVAGTVELSKSAPDLEMRLSFPVKGDQHINRCQSDYGFAEDSNNYYKLNESLQDWNVSSSRKEISSASDNSSQKWTVTIEDPNQGDIQNQTKQKSQRNFHHHRHFFPDLEPMQTRNTKKVFKKMGVEKSLRKVISRKLYAIWPKVQGIVQEEFLSVDDMLATEFPETPNEMSLLSVRGTAVPLEKKEKPLSMTQRDVTGRYTPRTTNSSFPSQTRSEEKVEK